MWVFGYGSLMADGWEEKFACTRRVVAELAGYRRAFNKASVANWGTATNPCPTLNLDQAADASCIGIAFEFPENQRAEVEAYLTKREGKNFVLQELQIAPQGAAPVLALVPIYAGHNIIHTTTSEELASCILQANGKSGSCVDYVVGVHRQLEQLGIDDPAVTQVRALLQLP
ncbi:gamma-glutamylcyclotransferase [Ralstonia pseudosolanacearum]|uniref:gamma-glutamylcyclotransferase n=1 Tax=Ralstonia pseudosolanacearum TaxID=1310165 RepID=UPI0009B7D465|nr:gamma-glutamylcyclotransferase [Ralstonia pseudosolanacearum]QKZ28316.1 gamma-glutamylcyclotransferase [Ralstonia solanacearum]MCK4150526.1 cation transporter [Ralstonia pseudosolanacearum]QKZ33283.1 gamma-glutamylcyclotransferase [Ralstonia solanacearum]QMT09570.1 gamma-glutamylcyclotransferase [Ralstonia solanacearum]BCL87321.1 gamma-glutamylcyclotransferase [Ralstonia solanacearum]